MTAPTTSQLVQRVWNLAHVLRNDGVGSSDYLEQLTFLLFLKMVDEQHTEFGDDDLPRIPEELSWSSLRVLDGVDLEIQYRRILTDLSTSEGLLGVIFRRAQNKITEPANLKRLVNLIDQQEWTRLPFDVKGEIYEGLLQKNAEDIKGGAGQYFTPRPLIDAMVEIVQPQPGETIADPACGTGGFLLAAREYLVKHFTLDPIEKDFLRNETFYGSDIVDSVVRLAAMNMFLHDIGGQSTPIHREDSLQRAPSQRFDIVLANPPFGVKGGMIVLGEDGTLEREKAEYSRDDFTAKTANKQLNFLQHIISMLKIGGRAAVVVPDNVLFEGGAGEIVRRRLLKDCDLHTILRLPTGIFYAQGVKANVLFFERRTSSETHHTRETWVYDLRTNKHFTLKTNPLKRADLQDFVDAYRAGDFAGRVEGERFKKFPLADLLARDKVNLDVFWLKDESLEDGENLPEPGVLAAEIIENLEAALEEFRQVAMDLGAVDFDAAADD
ncbi:type I restriction-modification system subunit M [Deinococcus pimensis]|uniref:type I restriction-modification system subunit M n=1 Tax=Deinococcus pimensis TaxID=309888 RepID=UPI000485D210|nr:class I SAM-dependent DNA methyltransferase [Deinococcus pimensis]